MPKAVIIGAGMSGATAAHELIKQGFKHEDILVLEKNSRLGGKLKYDALTQSDLGAVVLGIDSPNTALLSQYGFMKEDILPVEKQCLSQMVYKKQRVSFCDKVQHFISFTWQSIKYSRDVAKHDNRSDDSSPAAGHEIPFGELVQKKNLSLLADFLKPWVSGMGYGDVRSNKTYRILNYMHGSIFAGFLFKENLNWGMTCIYKGYQQLPEKMLADFAVKKSIRLLSIDRPQNAKTKIIYQDKTDLSQHSIETDLLILTVSPCRWDHLGLTLSDVERECVETVSAYRYPVAVCDIKGFPPEQIYVPEALDEEGFGHVAFINTRTAQPAGLPEGYRRCVVYINLSAEDKLFELTVGSEGRAVLLADLQKLGFNEVIIQGTKIWKDYNPTLPLEVSKKLEASQGMQNTLYLGTYSHKSFENVAGATQYAKQTICEFLTSLKPKSSNLEYLGRIYHFFKMPTYRLPDTRSVAEQPTTTLTNLNI